MKPEDAQRDRKALEILRRVAEMADIKSRAAWLEVACCGDAALKARVEALLANHIEDSFLQNAAASLGSGSTTIVDITEKAGDRVGRYKLLQQIGEGGCGVVYMAEQEEPVRRRVALKVIKLGMDTKQVVARFEAERQALAMMDHPNIARVLDAGATDTGRPYFVMELVRGIKITEFCDQQKLSTHARLDLFIQVCSAIQHAHQKGIIHRDLKPSNILVTTIDGTPVPKVIDFGIAKATNQQRLTDKTLFTAFEQFIGTPAYMSPEQAQMSGVDIDTRSDIYSLGVVLYELLTSRTPFDAEQLFRSGLEGIRQTLREQEPSKPSTALGTLAQANLTTVAHARCTESPRLLHQVRGDLDWVVMKCLEKDRARRYETASGFAADIQRHLDNEPVLACPPSSLYRIRKFVRRNQLVVTAVSAVAATIVVGLGASTWAFLNERAASARAVAAEREQSRERAKAEQASEAATEARDQTAGLLSLSQVERGVRLLDNHDHTGLLHVLEARRTVEHLPDERAARTLLWNGWFDSLPKSETKMLRTTNRLLSIAFCPARNWLATGTADGQVLLWDANTVRQVAAFQMGNQSVGSAEFSADGRLLVVKAGLQFQLWNLSPVLASQAPRSLVTNAQSIVFDPTRKQALTWAREGGGAAWKNQLWDEDAGQPRSSKWDADAVRRLMSSAVAQQAFGVSHFERALSPDGTKLAVGYDSLVLWDATEARVLQPMLRTNLTTGSRAMTRALFFSPDGHWLWESLGNQQCQRYEVATGKAVGDPIAGDGPLVSPDGQRFAMQRDGGLQLHHTETGASIGPPLRHEGKIGLAAVAFSPDGKLLATAGHESAVRVWDAHTGQAVGQPLVQPVAITALAFNGDGQSLGVITQDGAARLHRVTPLAPAPLRELTNARVLGINPPGHLLVDFFGNRELKWLDAITGEPVSKTWNLPAGESLLSTAVSPDGRMLASVTQKGGEQASIHFVNALTSVALEPSITLNSAVHLAFSPDSNTLAGVNQRDGSIQFWDVATRQAQAKLSWPDPPDLSWLGLQFSLDGKYVAARTGMKSIHVWDVTARKLLGKPVRDTMGNSVTEYYMAISPDWKLALAAGGLLDFTDPKQPRPVLPSIPTPAAQSAYDAAFSPGGRLLALSLRDKSVRLWDLATGRPWGQVMKTTDGAAQMAFSLDGRLLVTAGGTMTSATVFSGNIRLWETATGQPCGLPLPFSGMPMDLRLDPNLKFACVSVAQMGGGKRPPSVQVWRLPSAEMPLAEMQRQTWLKSGTRLDPSGNVEVIPAREILQLEVATP